MQQQNKRKEEPFAARALRIVVKTFFVLFGLFLVLAIYAIMTADPNRLTYEDWCKGEGHETIEDCKRASPKSVWN